ncbi:cupin domain-containing protein [Parvularcula maris]|uniref:Cupin domain-containing protein n=1 Tax=Parvularcula maris TaxID=2965077 RepID=A0A9X2RHQ6_9PROT|nr:cupin domain-containing protein [Parvularcula maris]
MLEKIAIADLAEARIDRFFDPHIVADVNEAQVKVAKFGSAFDWHSHPEEDEAFLVLKGRVAIDLRDGTVELEEGDFLNVPAGVEHRPRALSESPIVLMFERATTLNTGDAESRFTVETPKRLVP